MFFRLVKKYCATQRLNVELVGIPAWKYLLSENVIPLPSMAMLCDWSPDTLMVNTPSSSPVVPFVAA